MLSKQYMSATSHIESSLWIEYSWLQITRTSRQLEVIFASLQIISMSLKKNGVLKSETLHSIQLKTTVSIFCPPLFFVTPVQIHCPFPCVISSVVAFKIPCSQYQSLFLAAFEVKNAWYLRSFPIHLLISGYLFRSHDNSNVFRFP